MVSRTLPLITMPHTFIRTLLPEGFRTMAVD
jgi:hypothetical protein